MKTEIKVLLYLKRSEQNPDDLCPVMGKITLTGYIDSIAQFSTKINVNPKLWNSTAQRCIGKSRTSIVINREIESILLLIRSRFNEFSTTPMTKGFWSDLRDAFVKTAVMDGTGASVGAIVAGFGAFPGAFGTSMFYYAGEVVNSF